MKLVGLEILVDFSTPAILLGNFFHEVTELLATYCRLFDVVLDGAGEMEEDVPKPFEVPTEILLAVRLLLCEMELAEEVEVVKPETTAASTAAQV